MNLRRLIPLASSIILLGISAASAHAMSPTHSTSGVDAAGLILTSDSSFAAPVPPPSSGLLFLAGVGVLAGALELRKRKFAMNQTTH